MAWSGDGGGGEGMANKTARPEYLAATDGSPASDKAMDFAIARAKEAGARLVIIMAVEGTLMGAPSAGGASSVDLSVQMEREAWAKVRNDEGRARAAGLEARAEIVKVFPPNDIAVAIVKYAEEKRVHSIFVGSHGRTGLMRQMLGSTADKVVKLAHCHVTVVR